MSKDKNTINLSSQLSIWLRQSPDSMKI